MTGLIHFTAVLAVFGALDAIWLGLIARRFYVEQLGPLLREPVWWLPAVAFYLIFTVGLTILAVMPAVRGGGWTTALGLGALVGFVAYATYDLTSLATTRGFPTVYALVDIAWGTVLSAVAAVGGYAIPKVFGG